MLAWIVAEVADLSLRRGKTRLARRSKEINKVRKNEEKMMYDDGCGVGVTL